MPHAGCCHPSNTPEQPRFAVLSLLDALPILCVPSPWHQHAPTTDRPALPSHLSLDILGTVDAPCWLLPPFQNSGAASLCSGPRPGRVRTCVRAESVAPARTNDRPPSATLTSFSRYSGDG